MSRRRYYSVRTGGHPQGPTIDLDLLKRLFLGVYEEFGRQGYFQEAFGYGCVDAGSVAGQLGSDVEVAILQAIRKTNLYPVEVHVANYSEDDLFDMIEFIYDWVSKPIDGSYHNYNECGMHWSTFDHAAGQAVFRREVNGILADYRSGFELSMDGEILALAETGLENLFRADLPKYDHENVEQRVDIAMRKYRRHNASLDERRDAIRDLADVLEFLRPRLQEVMTAKDENDLFNIANNFGLRHHNDKQKTGYDRSIWYSWMFYYYLATIHAVLRLIRKAEQNTDA